MKAAMLLGLLLFLLAATGRAQSALDGFDPNANDVVRVVVTQPDGKILIGGDFTTLSPNGGASVTRNHIARINPDGTLDSAFDANANGTVNSIAVQADGKVLAGGSFTSIGGQPRNRLARLDATTGSADSFDPNADKTVFAIALQTDGKILAGGFFANIGGQPRNRIARLDATSGFADTFDPNANGPEIFAIVVQPDGRILAGGFFTTIGGQTRNNIARLDPTTGLADSFSPNASDEVRCMAVQADGKVLAGGFFTLIGGQSRNNLARLDAVTGLADSFSPNPSGGVFTLAVQADGKILAGGEFFNVGGQSRHLIARLDPITGLADSFDPSANSNVNAIAVQADGKVLAGGGFSTLSPNGGAVVTRNHIGRLQTDGRADRTLNLNMTGSIFAIAVQPDEKILIVGEFATVLGVTRNNLARLNSDGTLDIAFNPNANFPVFAIAVQADGKILAGGQFFNIGGQSRNRIARLDPLTGLADSFNPDADNTVYTIAVQEDGRILVAGIFVQIGGQTREGMARLDPVTGLADLFDPHVSSLGVLAITVQTDGKILVGGSFKMIGGAMRNNIARLDPETGSADNFNPNANASVIAIVVQPIGRILVGGFFSGANSIGGQMRNSIARLDAASGLADAWDPNANLPVNSIAVQSDGKILVGGYFNGENSIGGQLRNRIARLDPTTGLADSFNPNANNTVYTIAMQADGKILASGSFSGFNSIGGATRNHIARLDATTGSADSFDPSVNEHVNSVSVRSHGTNLSKGQFTSLALNWWVSAGVEALLPYASPPTADRPTQAPGNTPGPTPCSVAVLAEKFDALTPPALPTGWIATNAIGTGSRWFTTTSLPDSGPNAAFVDDPDFISDKRLDTSAFTVSSAFGQIGFRNYYDLDSQPGPFFFDGGVLEVSSPNINGGAFTDITDTAVGGSFVTGGYNGTIHSCCGSPIAGRMAWSGDSGGYITTIANLGPNLVGQTVKLRFRMVSDESVFAPGWRIDTIVVTGGLCGTPTPAPLLRISGNVSYCSDPNPGPVPEVMLSLTGSVSSSTLSDGSGNYTFSSLVPGGDYAVTPSKTTLPPGSADINTVDVVATQRHFLILGTPLSGCRLLAADVNGDSAINSLDVIAIQRFYLALAAGIANTGKYRFIPANRTYSGVTTDQDAQNYDTLIFGDVARPFADHPRGLSQDAQEGGTGAGKLYATKSVSIFSPSTARFPWDRNHTAPLPRRLNPLAP